MQGFDPEAGLCRAVSVIAIMLWLRDVTQGVVRCSSIRCFSVAGWRAYWPGQTCLKCDRCFRQAQAVALAMGFVLQASELPPAPPPLDAGRFALLEIDP